METRGFTEHAGNWPKFRYLSEIKFNACVLGGKPIPSRRFPACEGRWPIDNPFLRLARQPPGSFVTSVKRDQKVELEIDGVVT